MAKPKPGGRRPRKRERKNISVGVRALSTDRESLTVTDALEATDFDLALDVLLHIAAQVTFDGDVLIDPTTDAIDFVFREITDASVRAEAGGLADLL